MNELNHFGNFNFSIDVFVTLTLYLIIGAYTIFSAIFYYHWNAYATDAKVTTYTFILYFSTTLPILLIMIIMALIIK